MREKMPESMTEEAVAEWLYDSTPPGNRSLLRSAWALTARAVLALVEAKVREGAIASYRYCGREAYIVEVNAIVARVMGTGAERRPVVPVPAQRTLTLDAKGRPITIDAEGRPLWVRVTGLNGAITTPVGVHVGSVHAVTRWDTDGSPIVRPPTWGDFFLCGRGDPSASHNRCLPTWEPCAAPTA